MRPRAPSSVQAHTTGHTGAKTHPTQGIISYPITVAYLVWDYILERIYKCLWTPALGACAVLAQGALHYLFCSRGSGRRKWDFPKIRLPYLGVLTIRILPIQGTILGSPILGKAQILNL